MMKSPFKLPLIGYACGLGAGDIRCAEGPIKMQTSPYLHKENVTWVDILTPLDQQTKLAALKTVTELSQRLARMTNQLAEANNFFMTIGGDHTSAIGTWSGLAAAIQPKALGLLWIDAHLDSHTIETTPSGNIHGMPLAALLGQGDPSITEIMTNTPKLLPENVCILGVRSFEQEEKELLEQLKVRVYYMDEVRSRGFQTVFDEAITKICLHSDSFGISLDLDAIDPLEAPGVGTPVPDGIDLKSLYQALDLLTQNPKFFAAEIAEFNPSLDQNHKTEQIVAHIVEQFATNLERGMRHVK